MNNNVGSRVMRPILRCVRSSRAKGDNSAKGDATLFTTEYKGSVPFSNWQGLGPDVLLIPIGGLGNNTWTMDAKEALEAVKIIKPKLVIPCHYRVPILWKKVSANADDVYFMSEVEKSGMACRIMHCGDEIEI